MRTRAIRDPRHRWRNGRLTHIVTVGTEPVGVMSRVPRWQRASVPFVRFNPLTYDPWLPLGGRILLNRADLDRAARAAARQTA